MKRVAAWGAFWLVAGLFYVWFFGRDAARYADVLNVAVPLVGIAMATSYVMGWVLLPRFLLRRRYLQFALFSTYTLIVSVYLVLAVIVGVFMMAGLSVREMAPAALDRPGLLVGVYLVVATALFFRLLGNWEVLRESHTRLESDARSAKDRLEEVEAALQAALRSGESGHIDVQIDRRTVRLKTVDITYLESAGDYVLISTADERLITKARLSSLSERLAPFGFLRVHRSFVVRLGAVDRWSSTELAVGEHRIPVGRTYRPAVRHALSGHHEPDAAFE